MQILNDFYEWRYPIYQKRYEWIIQDYTNKLNILNDKIKFIQLDL